MGTGRRPVTPKAIIAAGFGTRFQIDARVPERFHTLKPSLKPADLRRESGYSENPAVESDQASD